MAGHLSAFDSATLSLVRMSATQSASEIANIDLSSVRLRANPAYELVLLDRLNESEQQLLFGLLSDPDCYGVLRPRQRETLSMKAVSRDTALLLFSLREAGTLPRFAVQSLGADCANAIGRMILDGILEVEVNGTMISGPRASASIWGDAAASESESRSSLAAISRRAIQYAASLRSNDALELSARLYAYNCIPSSRRWRESLPDNDATAEYLGMRNGAAARALAGRWHSLPESPAWISWRCDDVHRRSRQVHSEVTYKLYVSPHCGNLREAVQAIAASLARANAQQWKVGRGIHNLLRPDKMVIYFDEFSDLQEVALRVLSRLEGCPAHGVPFTAELTASGLLSWGIDPVGDPTSLAWSGGESWRGKLCDRLAVAIVLASAPHDREPKSEAITQPEIVRFALHRLSLEGIDTNTWTPASGFVWAS